MVIKIKNKKIIMYVSIVALLMTLAILIPLGFATGYDSNDTFFDTTKSSAGGKNLKEAIDEMNYYASINCPTDNTCQSNTPKCVRATTLHTETCSNNTITEQYCQGAGYSNGATITYGNTTTTSGILATGDAFDCDVDGTGYNHRFYYVSDYYDTSTNNFNDKVAVLIYYSNVRGGVANTSGTAYDCTKQNHNGPVTAIEQLPTTTRWSNIRLYKNARQILTQTNATETIGGTLPTAFSYAGYSARLLTYQEIFRGCNSFAVLPSTSKGFEEKCLFLMEGTKFSNKSLATYGAWLETPIATTLASYYTGSVYRSFSSYTTNNTTVGVRPTIEILKSEISY